MTRPADFSRKARAAIALRANGCCEKCGAKLKVGEGDADHILPAELGGLGTVENGQWLCRPCHKEKTVDDVRRIRKADRQRDRHSGALQSKRPMPGGRKSKFKRRFDGTIVER